MGYGLMADGVVVIHGLFILFAVLGGFLVVWKPWLAYVHVPAMAWAAYIEFAGGICPLTPLENTFRKLGGEAGSTMGDIVSQVRRMTDLMAEIKASANEQSSGIGQVNHAVASIDQGTQQNAALVEESAAAAESLRQQAAGLLDVIAQFKTAPQRHRLA